MRLKTIMTVAACSMTGIAALVAHAQTAPAMVDNPLYTSWAKFKPGSNKASTGAITRGDKTFQRVIVVTLQSVTPEGAVVDSVVTDDGVQTMVKEVTIPAKVESPAVVPAAPVEVEAMGKKFQCAVYELQAVAFGDKSGSTDITATCYLSDDVPGGTVKMIVHVPQHEITAMVTAFDAK